MKKDSRKKNTILRRQYYYFALWLPVIFPPFLFFSSSQIIFNLTVFGTIQYVVFALFYIFKYRGATTRELKRFAVTAPLTFIPFYVSGFLLLYMAFNAEIPSFDVFMITLVFSLLCIPFGYCYVLLSYIIEVILEKLGIIEDEL